MATHTPKTTKTETFIPRAIDAYAAVPDSDFHPYGDSSAEPVDPFAWYKRWKDTGKTASER